jgi:ABC-2 type transport system ATP-binding protein
MDEGHVKQHGSLREVLTAYKGKDPFAHMNKETVARLTNEPPVLTSKSSEV